MIDTDHPELVEFEGETLGDTLTNLLAEVKRLREQLKHINQLSLIYIEEDDGHIAFLEADAILSAIHQTTVLNKLVPVADWLIDKWSEEE